MAEWKTLFSGEKNGRRVTLEQYYEGNSLRLTVLPNGDHASDVSASEGVAQTPETDGRAKLEIHAADATQLERRLVEEGGFSEVAARELARLGHVESASVPSPEKP
jgi:hypothetical protein